MLVPPSAPPNPIVKPRLPLKTRGRWGKKRRRTHFLYPTLPLDARAVSLAPTHTSPCPSCDASPRFFGRTKRALVLPPPSSLHSLTPSALAVCSFFFFLLFLLVNLRCPLGPPAQSCISVVQSARIDTNMHRRCRHA